MEYTLDVLPAWELGVEDRGGEGKKGSNFSSW